MLSKIFYTTAFFLFIPFVQPAIPTPNEPPKNNSNLTQPVSSKPIYKIGIILPNATAVKENDPNLGNMIVTSDVAIKLAADSIKQKNLLPGINELKIPSNNQTVLTNRSTDANYN